MKVVTTITKRPELTRVEFQDYYENHHAPLGTRHFPFEKYVRNHVIEAEPAVGFHCLMECWLDRDKALASLDGAMGALFAEDEARFMVTRGIGVDVVEHEIGAAPRAVDPRGIAKTAFLLANAGDLPAPDFAMAAGDWGKSLVAANPYLKTATLDIVLPGGDPGGLAADAVVTLWAPRRTVSLVDLPAGVGLLAILTLESQETPPDELTANFGS